MDDNRKQDNGFFKQIHWKTTRRFLRNLAFGGDTKMRRYTFLVLCCFGLAGVLIDLDHLLIIETQMVRPLHLPIWVTLWVMCICYYAYINRRFHKLGIKKEEDIVR